MARLDHLTSAEDLVQVGAAIGREFTYELLDAVAAREPADLDQALARLVKSELVFQRGTPPEAVYAFKHALVQDVAYASMLKSRRSELHGRIAAVLEARFADLVARQPELLAHHLTAAGLADRAIDFWLRAGQLAVGRSANREAISHLTTALEMLGNRPSTDEQMRRELEVQIALGPPLTATRGFAAPEVETAHARAEHLARRYGHRRHLARALRGLCYVNHVRGHILRTSELGSELVDLAEQGDDLVMQADAHNALAFNLFHRGEHRPARRRAPCGDVRASCSVPAPYPAKRSMVANLVATVGMRLRNVARPNAPARLLPMTALASHQCAGSRRRLRQAKRTRPAGAAPP
jgi:hypothetical protein